ncbi:MAG: hypothetical protein M0P31_09080 [Solirubrobacteraceae bacterium]|nr:hypothetical protein [Solirubrobacteraceae bacterium]
MSQSGPTTTAPRRPFATTLIALVLGGLVGLLGAAPTHAATTREHVTPSSGANPTGLTAGPDGAIWFTQPGSGRIGRVTTDGTIVEHPANVPDTVIDPPPVTVGPQPPPTIIPAPPLTPDRIATGPDGALWYTIAEGGIARMTTDGVVTRYPVPVAGRTAGITAGRDGAMWFTMPDVDRIGRITAPTAAEVERGATRGVVQTWSLAGSGRAPGDITAAADGALWFVEPGADAIGRAVPVAGGDPLITHVPVPAGSAPRGIAIGPDGAAWFTAPGRARIGRIDAALQVRDLPLSGRGPVPGDIAAGPDGALWFTDVGAGRDSIGRITVEGADSRYPLPGSGSPLDLAAGADGALWYTRPGDRVGSVTPVARPSAGRSVSLEPLSSRPVRIRRPGSSTWTTLPTSGALLETGTEVDVTDSWVRLTSAISPGSELTRTADFRYGRFKVTQPRKAGAATELRLAGPLVCPRPRTRGTKRARTRAAVRTPPAVPVVTAGGLGVVGAFVGGSAVTAAPGSDGARTAKKRRKKPKAKARRKKPKVARRLWGNGKGAFRTRGARATASVRGTHWLVEDRCDRSTRVRVFSGVVRARDTVRGRSVELRDGQQLIARAAKAKPKAKRR